MTTIYHPRDNRRRQSRRRTKFGVLFVILCIVIMINVVYPQLFSRPVHAAAFPFLHSRNIFSDTFGGLWGILQSKRALVEENLVLKDTLARFDAVEAEKNHFEMKIKV